MKTQVQVQVGDLERLWVLHQNGAMTETEYHKAKARVLDCVNRLGSPPRWMKAAAAWALILSIGGCALIAYWKANLLDYSHGTSGHYPDIPEIAAYTLLNPLALVLFPLGLYWSARSAES